VYPSHGAPQDFLAFVAQVEELGFAHLWVVEDCFLTGGLTLAASALAITDTLKIGVGLMPVPMRNPALAAMEIATLAGAHPGRFTPTFGHGVSSWMRQIGAAPKNRLAALEETVQAVRALLDGQMVTRQGTYINLDQVALERPPTVAPSLLIGSTGPIGLQLAGRVADGVLLPEGCGPGFVRWAIEQMSAHAQLPDTARAGRRCVLYSWLALDDSPERALSWLLPALEKWAASPLYRYPRALAGLEKHPADGAPPLEGNALAELAGRATVCGDPATCAGAIAALHAAGADEIMLVPQGPDGLSQLKAFVEHVVPLLEVH
jgi:5,10-methylenetetrahydromethanopterin reductase